MIDGEKRLGDFEILSGSDTCTIHREFGYSYFLDVKKVFFTTHLAYERSRVASTVLPHELVLILFCGAGPFAILIAHGGAMVTAVELNADACRYLAYNAKLNKVENKVFIIKGDVDSIPEMIDQCFTRAILPVPYGKDHFIEKLSPLMEKEGKMHIYTFKKDHQLQDLTKEYNRMGFKVLFHRRCGNIAPGVSRWVFDLIKH